KVFVLVSIVQPAEDPQGRPFVAASVHKLVTSRQVQFATVRIHQVSSFGHLHPIFIMLRIPTGNSLEGVVSPSFFISGKQFTHVPIAPRGGVPHPIVSSTGVWFINQIGTRRPKIVCRKYPTSLMLMEVVGVKSIVRINGQSLNGA